MTILDELIAQLEAGEHPDLPRDIEMKYQAWSGGQFSKLTIIYLEKLSDRVTKLESQLKED